MAQIAILVGSLLAELTLKSVLKTVGGKLAGTAVGKIGDMIWKDLFPEEESLAEKRIGMSLDEIKADQQRIIQLQQAAVQQLTSLGTKLDALTKDLSLMESTIIAEIQLSAVRDARNKIYNTMIGLANAIDGDDHESYLKRIQQVDDPTSIADLLLNMHRALVSEQLTMSRPILPHLLEVFRTKLENTNGNYDYSVFHFLNDVHRWLSMLTLCERMGCLLMVARYQQRRSKTFNPDQAIAKALEASDARVEEWRQVFQDYTSTKPAFIHLLDERDRQKGKQTQKSPRLFLLRQADRTVLGTSNGFDVRSEGRVHGKAKQEWTLTVDDEGYWYMHGANQREGGKLKSIQIPKSHNPASGLAQGNWETKKASVKLKLIPIDATDSFSQTRMNSVDKICVKIAAPSAERLWVTVALDALYPLYRPLTVEDCASQFKSSDYWTSGTIEVTDPTILLRPLSLTEGNFTRNDPTEVEAAKGETGSSINCLAFIGQPFYFSDRTYSKPGPMKDYADLSAANDYALTVLSFAVWKVSDLASTTNDLEKRRLLRDLILPTREGWLSQDSNRTQHMSYLHVVVSINQSQYGKGQTKVDLFETSENQVSDASKREILFKDASLPFGEGTSKITRSVYLNKSTVTVEKIVPKRVYPNPNVIDSPGGAIKIAVQS